jgi:hypothetical protein
MLFPEIFEAFDRFLEKRDWQIVEQTRVVCRKRNLELARTVKSIAGDIGNIPDEQVQNAFHSRIIEPLGLETPQ